MILYLSSATDPSIFNKQFNDKLIIGQNPAQTFNYNILKGLGKAFKVVSVSALPYIDANIAEINEEIDDVKYKVVSNKKGKLRKLNNIYQLFTEAKKLNASGERIDYIICDVTCMSANYVAYLLRKVFSVKVLAIVTDIPGIMDRKQIGFVDRMTINMIKKYDSFMFLTKEMIEFFDAQNKPYVIIEGLYNPKSVRQAAAVDERKKICLYTGAIWKDAGFEEMICGFEKANVEGYELHLYGEGDGRNDIEILCKKCKSVKYMGCVTIDEVRELQRTATLLLNPRKSGEEYAKYSFPSKIMEYMASGTPVLTTHMPGIPSEYDKHLFYVEDETAEGFCEAFKTALSYDMCTLCQRGIAAQKFLMDNKNSDVQCKKLYKLIG